MRWRRVRRVTTRLAMTFVTFAARVSAGLPPHRPDHPNRCSRRSQSPIHCPRPGAGRSRHLRRGAPQIFHLLRGVLRNLRLPPGVRGNPHDPPGVRRNPHVRRNLRLPPGAVQSHLPSLAASPGCRPPRQSSPPGRRSPDHRRSPRSRTCWHRYSHRPLRPLRPDLNRHSHSRLPSRRRPHPRSSPNHPLRPRSGLIHHPPSRRPSPPHPQHLQHRSPQLPGACGFPPTVTITTGRKGCVASLIRTYPFRLTPPNGGSRSSASKCASGAGARLANSNRRSTWLSRRLTQASAACMRC